MDGYFDIEVYLISEYSKTTMHTFCYLSRFLFSSPFQVLFGCYMNACIGTDSSAELLQNSELLLVRHSS